MSDSEALKLPKPLAEEIVAHAREEAPNECCGILASVNGVVSQVYRATNVDKSPVKYTVDPRDVIRIEQEAEQAGQEVVAYYHSHTFSEAYPSPTDVKLAPPSDLFDYQYVLVSLADKNHPVIRSFRIVDRRIDEVAVEMIE